MMNQDQEHLRLLSIFHYVVAGIAALFALFPLMHLVLGVAMVSGAFGQQEDEGARFFGLIVVLFAGVWILCGLSYAIFVALAGKYLARRQKYMFCLVIACITCAFMPFGTVLGVFTIIILNRESVKQLFGYSTHTGSTSSEAT
jgi:hypothetical protein